MFVTVAELKTYANLHGDGTDEENLLLQTYIDSAEDIVQNYLGYTLLEKERTTYRNGDNGRSIALDAKPVTLFSIEINGATTDLGKFLVTGEIVETLSETIRFLTGYKNIKIVYTAGYAVASLPGLIKLTILRIAALLASEANGRIAVTSTSDNNTGNRTYFKTTKYDDYLVQIVQYKIAEGI